MGVSVIQKTLNPLQSPSVKKVFRCFFITTTGEENKIYLSRGPGFWEIDKQC